MRRAARGTGHGRARSARSDSARARDTNPPSDTHPPALRGGRPRARARRWDKRWFSILASSSQLSYYKSPLDRQNGKAPAGAVDCIGCSVERLGVRADCVLAVTTRERVLTMRADSESDVQAWIRAILAAGGWTEGADAFGAGSVDVGASSPTRDTANSTDGPFANTSQTAAELTARPSAAAPPLSVTGEMPGMEGCASPRVQPDARRDSPSPTPNPLAARPDA
eukprot:2403264-Prymnesium_polylepis.1